MSQNSLAVTPGRSRSRTPSPPFCSLNHEATFRPPRMAMTPMLGKLRDMRSRTASFNLSGEEVHESNNVRVFLHQFLPEGPSDMLEFEFLKRNTAEDLLSMVVEKCQIKRAKEDFELCEVMATLDGKTCKERIVDVNEYPVALQLLWPKPLPSLASEGVGTLAEYRFVFRRKSGAEQGTSTGTRASTIDAFLAKFLQQPKDKEHPDLCMLPELTEQTLLENLRDRFNSGHIYTYIGPILVAVNPFKFYPIYNPKYAQLYQNRRLGSLPPHIFAIADASYHKMLRTRQNQCIVISGESGSGKTESTNFFLHHLTALSQRGTGGAVHDLEQTLLCAGPVLEAFGNAVTAQNNNSSRFGKYIQVNYRENGMVSGANAQIYLLEKSRIISQAVEERNYHVFYYLLRGATEEERTNLMLMQPHDYHYLNRNGFYGSEDFTEEVYEFRRLRHSMELVGFAPESQTKIFTLISAVLMLGNVQFVQRTSYHSDDAAYIQNEEVVGIISNLLQVHEESLKQALTIRKTVLRTETVVTRYKVSEAINTRDAMAKCLYNALFHWIVLRINQALLKQDTSTLQKGRNIGILDIFGFEDVGGQFNSFEQFSINYANERLQTYFNQHIFQFEQEEYLNQGITWTNIEYTDNTECLTLIHGKPTGIFSLIDEESSIANGTDLTLLGKLNQFQQNHEYYEVPQKKEAAFIIAHYAGKVKYQVTGFREKNKDLMRQDVVTALKNSKSSFVRELVATDPVAVFRWAVLRGFFRAVSAFRSSLSDLKRSESFNNGGNSLEPPKEAKIARRNSESQLSAMLRGEIQPEVPSFCDASVFPQLINYVKKKTPKQKRSAGLHGLQALKALATTRKQNQAGSRKMLSVGAQFQTSLSRLMETLHDTNPFFIRCIRSNNEKIPCSFDEDIILRQLRYTGMLETVRIRRAGYSVRLTYEEFVAQYRMLLPKGRDSTNDDIISFIMYHPIIDSVNVQFGFSKVFMRDAEKLLLDDQLHRAIMSYILKLQSWFKAQLIRKRFLQQRSGAIKIQALMRGWMVRNRLQKEMMAALCIQTYWRGYFQRKKYGELKEAMTQLQALCRGFIIRHNVEEVVEEEVDVNGDMNSQITQPMQFFETSEHDDEGVDGEVGSPGQQSDEGILTKESSEDDNLQSHKKFPLDSEESSGILEDEEKWANVEAQATFTIDKETKLKLVSETVNVEQNTTQRRLSLAPTSSSVKFPLIRRTASSDQVSNKGVPTDLMDTSQVPSSPGSQGLPPPEGLRDRSASSSAAAKRRSGFVRAKRQLKAFLSRKSDQSEESEGDEWNPNTPATLRQRYPPKPKALSLLPDQNCGVYSEVELHSHYLKASWMHKTAPCTLCRRNVAGIFMQGYKCQACKLCFHKECAQFACKFPCSPTTSPSGPQSPVERGPWSTRPWSFSQRSHSTAQWTLSQQTPSSSNQSVSYLKSWNLNKTQQQTDPVDQILGGVDDLRQFSVFIFKKQTELAQKSQKKRDTMVDAIFKKSLREFHTELISYEAILREDCVGIKYRDLMACFEGSLSKVCVKEKITFPLPLGLNAFRGFLNEFMQQQSVRKVSTFRSKVTSFRKKKTKTDVTIVHKGHRFKADIVHVPTYCEICNQFMWHAEKIFICLGCRISCHKRCHSKLSQRCLQSGRESIAMGEFFGADLATLVDEEHPIPMILEKLLLNLEVRGLFQEGIYRKSAAAAQVKKMRTLIQFSKEPEQFCFDDVSVHVVASLVKAFFRELPEPLFTFELYENFLNVSEIPDSKDRTRCLYSMVDCLPKYNKGLLDRLMYHLARVGHQEEVNKMGAANLAIIFGPCLLRRSVTVHAQEQLQDMNRQAQCVEALIEGKLRHYRTAVSEIVELTQATEKVTENLRKIEDHVRRTSGDFSQAGADTTAREIEQARQLFVEQLEFLDKEKDKLIDELPPLAPMASSEDDALTSSDEVETPIEQRKKRMLSRQFSVFTEEYAIDLGAPPTFSTLVYFTKRRVPPPKGRKKPSRTFFSTWKQDILLHSSQHQLD